MRKSFCELCGPPRRAEFTVCKISDAGRREERNLCGQCAKDAERILFGDSRLPLTDLLNVLVLERSGSESDSDRTKVCPSCGNSVQRVLEAGEVGCSTCYSVFRKEIDEVVRAMHH
jgi:protein arginine kinase activator